MTSLEFLRLLCYKSAAGKWDVHQLLSGRCAGTLPKQDVIAGSRAFGRWERPGWQIEW